MDKVLLDVLFVYIISFVVIYFKLALSSEVDDSLDDDKPFPIGIKIYNMTVTCSKKHQPSKYRSHTYTCQDMRVGGLRMAYGYHPAINKNDRCNETKGFDEIAEVCRSLMRNMDSREKLWAAAVTNATCDYIDEKRVLLNMTWNGKFQWDSMKPGHGWVDTLQCLAAKKKKKKND